ncbi:MAG: methyltransferase [Candidatus Brocadia sinica]|nr:MAG: methyltransferase [Candidatus Brocadia sinica]MCK6467596.1 SAM-dependent methyltransferase [Candidatus Brocadia sinica]NUO04767.1 SAM-dependent methyltransferase [Candidatus Brocadia sinica]
MTGKETIEGVLKSSDELLKILDLNIDQSGDDREKKKFNEVVGFCEQVLRVIETYAADKEIVFLDCSCGKSYLSFALNYIFLKYLFRKAFFYGVDTNRVLIEKCEQIKKSLGFQNMLFVNGRIIDVQPEKYVDMVIALHACDIATDETIAKGIKLGAKYIIVVPCCENQIRGRLKAGHPLVGLTDFGLLRYRFADILTEALRSQFLTGAGYHVKLIEIVSPKFTPKNLMIIARKKKEYRNCNMDKYKKLDEMFNTKFVLKNYFDECELKRDDCFSSVNS